MGGREVVVGGRKEVDGSWLVRGGKSLYALGVMRCPGARDGLGGGN